ncbi:glycoside hydrolase family 3 N-terminal domain-containing protein [Lusitaniella coriacea]|uniref:glycoside hydrolase family 3 N-terminal domain-containing protein n=1 Tax=Lusitaniella coriacea TaxID=1983105 RepID=UPI003CF53EB5
MRDRVPPLQTLSLREQIAQMVVVRASGCLFDSQIRYPAWEPPLETLQQWISQLKVGGVIVLGGSAAEVSLRSRQLQDWAEIPLFIAADIEEGTGQRFAGATTFPPPMALSGIGDRAIAISYAEQMGATTAREAQAIGINWVLAPVVDVNNNPHNPVINIRAFGETPEIVSDLATAFLRGAQSYPVLTTAKHFPGHGDTAVDSHLHLPVVSHPIERLDAVELPPFNRAIAAGVDSVMTAHLLVPAWDTKYPATLSQKILTGQLRDKLGFNGLIVTDALVMGGVANFTDYQEVCVLAVEAGADILLMPQDPVAAIDAVEEAVQTGRISPQRIQASIERIWRAKQKILAGTTLDLSADSLLRELAQPEVKKTTREINQESLQLGGELPLSLPMEGENAENWVVVDDLLNCNFLAAHTPAIAVPKQLGYKLQLIEQHQLNLDRIPETALVQIFSRGNPFRGKAGLVPQAQEWFKLLLRQRKIVGLAIYGSPYILEELRSEFAPSLPWVFSYGQTALAQEGVTQVLWQKETRERSFSEAFI